MKLFITLLIFATFSTVQANLTCNVQMSDNIYYINLPLTKKIINQTNCPDEIITKLLKILSKFNDNISSDYITTAFNKALLPYSVTLSPKKIKIEPLEKFILNNLDLVGNYKIKNLSFVNNQQSLSLLKQDELQARCTSCMKTGNKNFELSIINLSKNRKKKLWLTGDLVQKVLVIKSQFHLRVDNKPLNSNLFTTQHIYSSIPEQFFSPADTISFYKYVGTKGDFGSGGGGSSVLTVLDKGYNPLASSGKAG